MAEIHVCLNGGIRRFPRRRSMRDGKPPSAIPPSKRLRQASGVLFTHVPRGGDRARDALVLGHPHVDLSLDYPQLVLVVVHEEAGALLRLADYRQALGYRVEQVVHLGGNRQCIVGWWSTPPVAYRFGGGGVANSVVCGQTVLLVLMAYGGVGVGADVGAGDGADDASVIGYEDVAGILMVRWCSRWIIV